MGTKRQAVKSIEDAAKACGQHYINIRWLGGTLTNWQTISERIKYLNEREAQFDAGEFNALNKKEQLDIQKEIDKLNRRLGGIKELTSLPEMLFVVDTQRESLAIKEAVRVGIPVIRPGRHQLRPGSHRHGHPLQRRFAPAHPLHHLPGRQRRQRRPRAGT